MGVRAPEHDRSVQRSWRATLGAVAQMAGHVLAPWRRGRRVTWGASDEERAAVLPGDDLIAAPTWGYTHAISIDAPAAAVWPWIAQLGQERGGFASFERLENLVGCRIRNATHIVEAWQHPAVGDEVHLHPKAPPLHIAVLVPGRSLVLRGAAHDAADPTGSSDDGPVPDNLWAFHLLPDGPASCRLVERGMTVHGPSLRDRLFLGTPLVEPIGFVMSREMLRSIKELAERECQR